MFLIIITPQNLKSSRAFRQNGFISATTKSKIEVEDPMNVQLKFTEDEQTMLSARKKAINGSSHAVCVCEFLRFGNEGGVGIDKIVTHFGVSKCTISNYVRHVVQAFL